MFARREENPGSIIPCQVTSSGKGPSERKKLKAHMGNYITRKMRKEGFPSWGDHPKKRGPKKKALSQKNHPMGEGGKRESISEKNLDRRLRGEGGHAWDLRSL